MNRHVVFSCAFVALLWGTSEKAYARRGIPIPIVCGTGEKLTELGELPDDVARDVASELATPVTVAFLHSRAHVFWLDLWTWNGRHVLHSGDKYWVPDSAAWERLLGVAPSTRYGTPILYRIPVVPALLAIGIVGMMVRSRFFKTEQERLKALMSDNRFQRSIATIFGTGDDQSSAKFITTLDEQRFLRAKDELISEGVDAHSAEFNLRKIANAILTNTNARIDAAFAAASQLDQQGEWDKSTEIYSQLISSLPGNDERLAYAENCLAKVAAKGGSFTNGQSGGQGHP